MNVFIGFGLMILRTLIVALMFSAFPAMAEWQADPDDKRQVKAAKAIAGFRERIPRTVQYFDDASDFDSIPCWRLGL